MMKKTAFVLLFILAISLFLPLTTVHADEELSDGAGAYELVNVAIVDAAVLAPRGSNYVIDETGTLTNAQIDALNVKAASLAEKRECGAYIWIVDLVPKEYEIKQIDDEWYVDDLEVYVEKFLYEKYDLGYGNDKNGMVLLLEIGDIPGERDYLIYTHGSCKGIFTNTTRESMLDDKIIPLFRKAFDNGNFYKVADVFLDEVEFEFVFDFGFWLVLKLAVVILIPIFTARFICSRWKSQMKTAVIARIADNYIPKDGFKLTGKEDTFLYRTTSRTRIERSSSSSSGGSSSSSSGSSSGGKV
jgi:uncharacterized membrane protein YgcG